MVSTKSTGLFRFNCHKSQSYYHCDSRIRRPNKTTIKPATGRYHEQVPSTSNHCKSFPKINTILYSHLFLGLSCDVYKKFHRQYSVSIYCLPFLATNSSHRSVDDSLKELHSSSLYRILNYPLSSYSFTLKIFQGIFLSRHLQFIVFSQRQEHVSHLVKAT
jgi:hypothetical protein